MTSDAAAAIKPHDEARLAIDSWRGHCLNLFARGERVIGQTLEAIRACAKDPTAIKLRHLAGQRADELARQLAILNLRPKQLTATADALARWRAHESRRVFLAHAILCVTLDSRGNWFAVFDMTVYRSDHPAFERWAVAQAEASNFTHDLETSGHQLSQMMGQVRKGLGT